MMPLCIFGQGRKEHLDYSPKTPEAAAFEQITEIPVGAYTGTPNVSIPLYTVKYGDLELPVSLDYLGTAIRVDQEATWVGLNWLLNAGGAITTQLSPSYSTEGGYLGEEKRAWNFLFNRASLQSVFPLSSSYSNQVPYKIDGLHPNRRGNFGKNWFDYPMYTEDTLNYNGDLPRQIYNMVLTHNDGESPTYHASFMGQSVSFIWDRLNEEFFITGEAQGYKISGSPRTSITIKDGNGIEYQFAALEMGYSEGASVDPSLNRFDCTFYLTKIKSPSGSEISLVYGPPGTSHSVYKVNETLYDGNYPFQAIDELASTQTVFNSTGVSNGWNLVRTLSQYYTFHPIHLQRIETNNQVVKFVQSSQNRLDIRGSEKYLQRIEIYRKLPGNTEQLLKRFQFQYSYSAKNTIGGNTVQDLVNTYSDWFPNDNFMYYRLMLTNVREETVENGVVRQKPAYQFAYNSTPLPCKASAAVDFWGYYNGKENYNGTYHTLIPRGFGNNTYDGTSGVSSTYLATHGADRRISESHMKAGMLTSISYPTGAITTFEYEPHTFSNFNYYSVPSAITQFETRKVYASNIPGYTQSGNHVYQYETAFDIPAEGRYKISCSFYKNNLQKLSYWRELIGKPALLFKYRTGTNQVESCKTVVLLAADTVNVTSNSILLQPSFILQPGQYKLTVPTLSTSTYPSALYQIDATISADINGQLSNISTGGGLRVKSINTVIDGVSTKTSYYYRDNNYGTSGLMMAPVIFARQKQLIHQPEEVQQIGGTTVYPHTALRKLYWMVSGTNQAPPASRNITYSRVEVVKTGDGAANGKTVYEYHNHRWANSSTYDYMRRVEDPLNGRLLKQTEYDENGVVVHVVQDSYQMSLVEWRLRNAVMENTYVGKHNATGGSIVSHNAYADALGGGCMMIYLYPSVQFSLLNSSSTESDFVNGQPMQLITQTVYNQHNHQEASVTSTTSRTGESILVEKLYPSDYSNHNGASALCSHHILNVPMETVTSVTTAEGQYVTDAERREYSSAGVPTSISILKNAPVLKSSFVMSNIQNNQRFYDATTTITYNYANRPRMVSEYGTLNTVYLWGYNSQYPIAVIKGADENMVLNILGGVNSVYALESSMVPTLTPEDLYAQLFFLPNALVTVFDYNPHTGMVKMIAPNGETTTYDYDSFARLSSITDHDGIVSESFQYHYKNEQ